LKIGWLICEPSETIEVFQHGQVLIDAMIICGRLANPAAEVE
jgi:hypothetical protein